MSNRPVVHFERGDRHQYATVIEAQDPITFSHHCLRDDLEFEMPEEFYASDPHQHITPEQFKTFLEQAGVDCSPK